MTDDDPHRRIRHAIAVHFRGAGAPAIQREMRAHLPVCGDCHAYYEQHLLLASLDPAGLSSEVRLARGLGLRLGGGRPAGRNTFGWLGLCGASVAALAVFYAAGGGVGGLLHRARGQATPAPAGLAAEPVVEVLPAEPVVDVPPAEPVVDVVPRGGPASVAAARTPELQIYRFARGAREGVAEEAGDVIYAGDALAFAYRNPAGKGRLLVFAVDEHAHVYWYYPGWSDAADNPRAFPISAEPGLHELPAAVLHKFDGERVMIHALFTDREFSVREIESVVAAVSAHDRTAGASTPLFMPGVVDIVRPLRVLR